MTNAVLLTSDNEKLLAAAYAAGMSVAYGYMGGNGHFNPVVVCVESDFLDATLKDVDDRKIVCDQDGEWSFA